MLSRMGVYAIRVGLLIGWLAGMASAQPSNGYVFFAPGGESCCQNTSMTLQFGAGGEAVLGKGVGVGAEMGALGIRQDYLDTVSGVLSLNGYYHFRHRRELKADPFVTGGYSLLFRAGHANLANLGAGLNYWFTGRLGARLEIRDQFNTNGTIEHFWGVRFGLAFR